MPYNLRPQFECKSKGPDVQLSTLRMSSEHGRTTRTNLEHPGIDGPMEVGGEHCIYAKKSRVLQSRHSLSLSSHFSLPFPFLSFPLISFPFLPFPFPLPFLAFSSPFPSFPFPFLSAIRFLSLICLRYVYHSVPSYSAHRHQPLKNMESMFLSPACAILAQVPWCGPCGHIPHQWGHQLFLRFDCSPLLSFNSFPGSSSPFLSLCSFNDVL